MRSTAHCKQDGNGLDQRANKISGELVEIVSPRRQIERYQGGGVAAGVDDHDGKPMHTLAIQQGSLSMLELAVAMKTDSEEQVCFCV